MPKQSAGLLLCRHRDESLQVLLVHLGGPFWKNRDAGAWSIPKGEFSTDEDTLAAAQREFHEETGLIATGDFQSLEPIKQRGGKTVYAWLVESDLDLSNFQSNRFTMEWPPRSGKLTDFPEIDRVEWFTIDAAREKILDAQIPLLDEAVIKLQSR
jgi:predicted NUDIX family NTP pyrophosphohydrolase